MFLQRLVNQGSIPVLEQLVRFTAQRHRLLADNIANVDTPNYRQKDLSVARFQKELRQRVERLRRGEVANANVPLKVEESAGGMLFHDGNDRNVEMLMSEHAKNAMMHNMALELLRKQYQSLETALRERIG